MGANNVGKKSLISRYVNDAFGINDRPSITPDVSKKTVLLDRREYRLEIIDLNIEFQRKAYMSYLNTFLICFDLSDNQTSDQAINLWREIQDVKSNNDILDFDNIFFVGTKSDEVKNVKLCKNLKYLVKEKGYKLIKTSSKDNINVNEAFIEAIRGSIASEIKDKEWRQLEKGIKFNEKKKSKCSIM